MRKFNEINTLGNSHEFERNNLPRPEVILGVVSKVTNRVDGVVVCDVFTHDGQYYAACPTIQMGGSAQAFTSSPYLEGSSVALLVTSNNSPAYILGSVYKNTHRGLYSNNVVEGLSTDQTSRKIHGKEDWVVENRGNFVRLSPVDGICINSSEDVKMDIADGKSYRFAKGGKSSDIAVNGIKNISETMDWYQKLYDKLELLQAQVDANTDCLGATTNAVVSALTAEALIQANAGNAAEAQALTEEATNYPAKVTSATTAQTSSAALQAEDGNQWGARAAKALNGSFRLP